MTRSARFGPLGALALVALAGAPRCATAQVADLPSLVPYSGTFVETTVPDLRGSIVKFVLLGGDGGNGVIWDNDRTVIRCLGGGGSGGSTEIQTIIDDAAGRLRPGGKLRYIVGQRGRDGEALTQDVSAGGGGGGGTGLLYRPPSNSPWEFLAVAGGGGGGLGYRGVFGACTSGRTGGAAETGFVGGPADNFTLGTPAGGGADGGGGQGDHAGGGGGAVSAGARGDENPAGGGGLAGGQTGAAGGLGNVSNATHFGGNGGWGYGGGGGGSRSGNTGGGGGGGYSGGGGGGNGSGGGGAALFNGTYAISETRTRDSAGFSDGVITSTIVGQVHDDRANALTLSPSQTQIIGSTLGATSSGLDSCNASNLIPDVWYTYTNNSDESQVVQVANIGNASQIVLVDFLGVCLLTGPSSLSQPLAPGGEVFIGVASIESKFALSLSIETDSDGDGVPDSTDLCPGSDDAIDGDGDGVPNGCDLCPGFDDTIDIDSNGIPNACEDADGDGVPDSIDLCPGFDDSIDIDSNGIPDDCEDCDGDGVPNGIDMPFDLNNATSLGSLGTTDTRLVLTSCDPSTELNTHLVLWDDQGTVVQRQDDDAGCSFSGLSSTLEGTFPAGTYFLGVAGSGMFFGDTGFETSIPDGQCPADGLYVLRVGPSGNETALEGAMLNPGTIDVYSFVIDASSPCLADVNGDGDVTPADFNAWVLAFNNGAPGCDQNGDGQCTPADFNAWVLNYNAGC